MDNSVTITLRWVDVSNDFFDNTVAAVANRFGLCQPSLFQPVHDPAFAFYRKYSLDHPRANAGDKIWITVAFNHWPGRNPEVTDFTMTELASAPGTAATGKLSDDLREVISASDFTAGKNYDKVHDRINAASAQEKQAVLSDQALLASLRGKMFFDDFAKAAELLGLQLPQRDNSSIPRS